MPVQLPPKEDSSWAGCLWLILLVIALVLCAAFGGAFH